MSFSSPFNSKLRTFVGSAACVAVALGSVVSPALAQERSIWLADGELVTMTGYLLEGENVYADCDEDCSDLDLFLYNEVDKLVSADEALDSFPVVTAPYEGTFSVVVSMAACNHISGCAAAVRSDYGF
jgi:hypothetical protein